MKNVDVTKSFYKCYYYVRASKYGRIDTADYLYGTTRAALLRLHYAHDLLIYYKAPLYKSCMMLQNPSAAHDRPHRLIIDSSAPLINVVVICV